MLLVVFLQIFIYMKLIIYFETILTKIFLSYKLKNNDYVCVL